MATRRDLTKKYAKQYQQASKKDKGRMLDELCAATSWSRVNARRAIRDALTRKGSASAKKRKPRARKYSYDSLAVLIEVWSLVGEPCGKYLAPIMEDTLERLARFKELNKVKHRLTPLVETELVSMSAATIDRYLAPTKQARYPDAKSTTSASHILRSSIPIRTAMDGFPKEPGYLEIDTVAHCGSSTKGDWLVTICATDPFTGWTILRTVKNKAFIHMKAGMDWIVTHYPIPLKGVDFDNGSEFLNWGIIAWLDDKNIPTITRSRPYEHNDNAHVEQRNGDWVRKHAFRYRYEDDKEMLILNQLWAAVMNRKNYLLPCVKAQDWTTLASGRRRRTYDQPRTPWQRLLNTGALKGTRLTQHTTHYERLNPASLTRRVNNCQQKLITSIKEHPDRIR